MTARILDGKVAVVTGGSSGIGKAVVQAFIEHGASVAVFDKEPDSGPPVAGVGGRSCLAIEADVTNARDYEEAISTVLKEFGVLDIFVGNAGIHDGAVRLADLAIDEIGPAFDEVFEVNVKAYLVGARAVLPHLLASRGCMIFTASSSAFYAGGGGAIYSASKHAVVGIIRQLAHELAPFVRVNGVAPAGSVTGLRGPTTLGRGDVGFFEDGSDWDARIRSSKPLDFAPSPADHAGAYLLLAAGDMSRAMTGEVIRSDGGLGVRGLAQLAGGYDLVSARL